MRISDWISDVCSSDLFENHIRAICGLPLGSTNLVAAKIEMRNLIGDEVDDAGNILTEPSNHLHLYGKRKARRGRKMRSEEHTSELQSLMRISYTVFCLKQNKKKENTRTRDTATNNSTALNTNL